MIPLVWSLLQAVDESDAAPPFGTFMAAVPHWGFILIHSTLILVAVWLSRRVRGGGNVRAANGFLLFVLAELSYVTYHAHLTHFLFAHTLAEVLDILTLVVIGTSLARQRAA
jgi:hypothetical protein